MILPNGKEESLMKRSALIFSILFLLAMAGCSHTDDPSSVPGTGTAPKTEPSTETQTTSSGESVTDASGTETMEVPAPTEASETTESTEVSETSSVTTQTGTETTAFSETQTAETKNVSVSAQDLIGKWEFPDGYYLNFLEGGTVELSIDFSYDLKFKENTIEYLEKSYPFRVEGDIVTATGDGKTILEMTAVDGADAQELIGRFRLDACEIYYDQVIDHTEQTKVYYIECKGSRINLVMPSEYRAEEGVLTMTDEGNEMVFDFEISGNTLTVTDAEGYKDILTRVG